MFTFPCRYVLCGFVALSLPAFHSLVAAQDQPSRPNIVLVMADDMGWGQTGYYNHPVLKTPHLDAMSKSGLRFDRYYAAAPVCSPTRASVLTARSHRRTGVESHGYALRRQEKTIAQALAKIGYATGHFGKWHLNGLRGPGVPILAEDTHNPGVFGFETWLSVTNFFDVNPIMSRQGKFIEFKGDSSEIIVDEALKFIGEQARAKKPSLSVIWYGTPHSPFMASEEDSREFAKLDSQSQKHYGELVAMDRSIGALRKGLRDLNIADNTLVWFTSDNGGLPRIKPETVGGLRGFKGSVYEGGLRVPAIIEWPNGISKPRITKFPTVAMDIFPTIAEVVGLPESAMLKVKDGISVKGLLNKEWTRREKPIPFSYQNNTVILDNDLKLIRSKRRGSDKQIYELYDLANDPKESTNIQANRKADCERLMGVMSEWDKSLAGSVAGKDFPSGKLNPGEPEPRFWTAVKAYEPYFEAWKNRPEYASRLRTRPKQKSKKK